MSSTIERRQEIVDSVRQEGRVSVDELSSLYQVSTVTIRNDLNYLDKKGLLVRSRGGAVNNSKLIKELTINEKQTQNHPVKQAIGKLAADFIDNGDRIILDSGSTTEEITHHLHHYKDLTVMTNGLNILSRLSHIQDINLMMTGGTLRYTSQSFYGRQAEDSLKNYRFDRLFLAVDGFDIAAGLTTHFEQEASLNRYMCDISKQVIAVTDSSKFNRCGFHVICTFDQIDILITDNGIPEDYRQMLEKKGVEVILVDKDGSPGHSL